MANSVTSPVGATQVGSFFVKQYYQILQEQPDFTHWFYTDASSVIRVNGDATESASTLMQIHELYVSLNFAAIEIKTINSLESWNGGIVLVVSGNVKSKVGTGGTRKFVQTFFLAPQEKGYFVLNDVFHYVTEEAVNEPPASGASEVIHHLPAPVVVEKEFESQPTSSIPPHEEPVSDYALEAEAREYANSVNLEAIEPVEDFNFQEHEPEQNDEIEVVEEAAPLDVSMAFQQHDDDSAEGSLPVVEEPVGDAPKISYASILRAAKGNPPSTVTIQPSFNKKASQPALQLSKPAVSVVSNSPEDVVEESQPHKEGESKSVYVRNLPPGVSTLEVLEEFKNFGRIKQDGVFVNNRTEVGVCFAFVEFDDTEGAQKAVKASPLKFAGRQVYVEFRRPSANSASRGGGRAGRGRWWRPGVANNLTQGKQSGWY